MDGASFSPKLSAAPSAATLSRFNDVANSVDFLIPSLLKTTPRSWAFLFRRSRFSAPSISAGSASCGMCRASASTRRNCGSLIFASARVMPSSAATWSTMPFFIGMPMPRWRSNCSAAGSRPKRASWRVWPREPSVSSATLASMPISFIAPRAANLEAGAREVHAQRHRGATGCSDSTDDAAGPEDRLERPQREAERAGDVHRGVGYLAHALGDLVQVHLARERSDLTMNVDE